MAAIAPIEFIHPSADLGTDAQALVALTLTLMTAYVHGGPDVPEASAGHIAAHLEALAQRQELSEELRALCTRLQRLWAAMAD